VLAGLWHTCSLRDRVCAFGGFLKNCLMGMCLSPERKGGREWDGIALIALLAAGRAA
jgi:hypothetical protein